jgi:alternate signal-mediated exported protein
MSNDDNGIRLTRRRLLGGVAATGAATAGLGAGTYALYSDSEQSTGNTVSSGTLDLSLTDPSGGSGGFSKVGQAPTGPFNAKPGHQFKFKLTINNNGSIRGDYLNLDFSYTTSQGTKPGGDEGDTEDDAPSEITPDMGKLMQVAKLSYSINNSTTGTTFRSQSSSGPGGKLETLFRTGTGPYGSNEYEYDDNNIIDLANLVDASQSQDSSSDDVFDDLTPPPAGGSATLEGTVVFVDTANQVWPDEVYASGYNPVYEGPQKNNWFQGDEVTLEVDAEMGQS